MVRSAAHSASLAAGIVKAVNHNVPAWDPANRADLHPPVLGRKVLDVLLDAPDRRPVSELALRVGVREDAARHHLRRRGRRQEAE